MGACLDGRGQECAVSDGDRAYAATGVAGNEDEASEASGKDEDVARGKDVGVASGEGMASVEGVASGEGVASVEGVALTWDPLIADLALAWDQLLASISRVGAVGSA